MRCVVSGATGFIGRQLCRELMARGDTVVALSKHGAPLDNGKPTLAVDLARHDPDRESLEGVDVFFHLAGIAHRRGQDKDYDAVNYQATLRLAQLASDAGIRCFIFISSIKAMGPPPSAAVRSENDCTQPVDAYGRSKWQAESALREQFANDAMSVVIVRPALVYGSNAKGNLLKLAMGVQWGLPRPPAGGSRSMIALADLVQLMCSVARRPPSGGVHTWIACGSEAYSTLAIYDMLREAGGKEKGKSWWPLWIWRAGARLVDLVTRHRAGSTYETLFGTELYSNAAVLADTQWRPRTRLEDVIGQIARGARSDS